MKTVFSALALSVALGAVAADAKPFGPRGMGPQEFGGAFIFGEIDTNADGFITANELTAKGRERFDTADVNGDGFIDGDELQARQQAAMDRIAEHADEDRRERAEEHGEMMIERMLDRADENGDGKLSFAELDAARPDRMFDQMDANGDGKISEMEFHVATQHRGGHGPRSDRG